MLKMTELFLVASVLLKMQDCISDGPNAENNLWTVLIATVGALFIHTPKTADELERLARDLLNNFPPAGPAGAAALAVPTTASVINIRAAA